MGAVTGSSPGPRRIRASRPAAAAAAAAAGRSALNGSRHAAARAGRGRPQLASAGPEGPAGRRRPRRSDRDRGPPTERGFRSRDNERRGQKKKAPPPPPRPAPVLAAGESCLPFQPHAPFAAARRRPAQPLLGRTAGRSPAALFPPRFLPLPPPRRRRRGPRALNRTCSSDMAAGARHSRKPCARGAAPPLPAGPAAPADASAAPAVKRRRRPAARTA